jgi:hypothetical protein
VVLQEMLVATLPDELVQHCASCPNEAVHCDESLHVAYALGTRHPPALVRHVGAWPAIFVQQPSSAAQRIEPHSTLEGDADESLAKDPESPLAAAESRAVASPASPFEAGIPS